MRNVFTPDRKNCGVVMQADRLERNKTNVIAFYDLMFNEGRPSEAMERYAGETYTQHNPHVGDGIDIFRLDGNGKVVDSLGSPAWPTRG